MVKIIIEIKENGYTADVNFKEIMGKRHLEVKMVANIISFGRALVEQFKVSDAELEEYGDIEVDEVHNKPLDVIKIKKGKKNGNS